MSREAGTGCRRAGERIPAARFMRTSAGSRARRNTPTPRDRGRRAPLTRQRPPSHSRDAMPRRVSGAHRPRNAAKPRTGCVAFAAVAASFMGPGGPAPHSRLGPRNQSATGKGRGASAATRRPLLSMIGARGSRTAAHAAIPTFRGPSAPKPARMAPGYESVAATRPSDITEVHGPRQLRGPLTVDRWTSLSPFPSTDATRRADGFSPSLFGRIAAPCSPTKPTSCWAAPG